MWIREYLAHEFFGTGLFWSDNRAYLKGEEDNEVAVVLVSFQIRVNFFKPQRYIWYINLVHFRLRCFIFAIQCLCIPSILWGLFWYLKELKLRVKASPYSTLYLYIIPTVYLVIGMFAINKNYFSKQNSK